MTSLGLPQTKYALTLYVPVLHVDQSKRNLSPSEIDSTRRISNDITPQSLRAIPMMHHCRPKEHEGRTMYVVHRSEHMMPLEAI
jgi:hypothetical protein